MLCNEEIYDGEVYRFLFKFLEDGVELKGI